MSPVEVIVEHELFKEGDESTGIWVLESGTLKASAMDGSEDFIEAPDIVGEAVLFSPNFDKYCHTTVDSQSDPGLRERFEVRRITYTAETTCELWFLKREDIITLAQVIPDLIDNIKLSITQDLES